MGLSSRFSYKSGPQFLNEGKSWQLRVQQHTVQQEAKSTIYDPAGWLKNRVNSATYTDFENVRYLSSYYIQDASFLKMDNISLGYNFDQVINNPCRADSISR